MAKNDGYQLTEKVEEKGVRWVDDKRFPNLLPHPDDPSWSSESWRMETQGFTDTDSDSEIQRFRDAATERRRVGASVNTKRNETFHSDWKMLSNHRQTNTNDCNQPTNQPASERASDHKTKQANFQLILTRSTKAKTGNGHGPWPKRLEDLGPGWPRRTRLCNYESKCESERPRLERNPFPTFSRTSNFNWQ